MVTKSQSQRHLSPFLCIWLMRSCPLVHLVFRFPRDNKKNYVSSIICWNSINLYWTCRVKIHHLNSEIIHFCQIFYVEYGILSEKCHLIGHFGEIREVTPRGAQQKFHV